MRIPRVFIDIPLDIGTHITLPIEAHRHIINVLRLKEGHSVILFNGLGSEFLSQIVSIEKKQSSVKVLEENSTPTSSPLKIELALSLIKNDKFDFALQKSVELGIDSISPIVANRSTIKVDSKREQNRRNHWMGIIQNACEQSGRTTIPQLNPICSIDDWLTLSDSPVLLFEPTASATLQSLSPMKKVRVIIGPEGGFTDKELELMNHSNIHMLKLGPRVLRAETAAITAVSALQLLMGDLNL